MEAEKFLRKVARINGKDFDVVCQEKLQRLTDGYAKVAPCMVTIVLSLICILKVESK